MATPSDANLPRLGNWTGRKVAMVVVGTILMALSTWIVGLRLWIRYSRKGSRLGMDDAFIAVGWAFGIIFTVGTIYATCQFGYDRHMWEVPYTVWATSAMWGWLLELFYMVCTSATKLSILLFYRRLSSGTYSRKNLYPVYAALAYTALYTVVFMIILFIECLPFGTYWERYDPAFAGKFTCLNFRLSAPISGALSTFGDFIAVLIPWIVLSDLQVPLRQKIALYMIFAVGLLVVGAGIARTVFITELASGQLDLSWIAYHLFHAANLEIHIALMCASAPSLRALFSSFFRNTMSKLTRPTGLSSLSDWSNSSHKRSRDPLGDSTNHTIGSGGGFMKPLSKFRSQSEATELSSKFSRASRSTNQSANFSTVRADTNLSRKTSRSSRHSRKNSLPPIPTEPNAAAGGPSDPAFFCPNADAGGISFITAPTFLETADSSEEDDKQPLSTLTVIPEDVGPPCPCCGKHHETADYSAQAQFVYPFDTAAGTASPVVQRGQYGNHVVGQAVSAFGFPTDPERAVVQPGPHRYGYSAHVSSSSGRREPTQMV